ncbi:zeta toxin family protein [Clostridium perfringens]|uniref:zeta toxin family protein n=1 Tax=Clostridium perfringens TaxID=1502 RepID=UPI0024BD4347|nr:zeta toxin family protein [Clostridium perfringens]
MNNSRKTYTLFAGVNGAGKTSIYDSIYYTDNKLEKRINTDEMVSSLGSWKDNNLQIKCARQAIKLIKDYINQGVSFNQETTLSGKSIIRNIKLAKASGYYVIMNYIGVDTVDIAKERVRLRVKKGGHGIQDSDIERRYTDSFKNLVSVINICDEITIFDNTKFFKDVMYIKNGEITWMKEELPIWLKNLSLK